MCVYVPYNRPSVLDHDLKLKGLVKLGDTWMDGLSFAVGDCSTFCTLLHIRYKLVNLFTVNKVSHLLLLHSNR